MKTPIVLLEGEQLEIDFDQIDFNLDRPQLSICPQCDSKVIRLADGCDVCGWREQQSPSVGSYSISCTVKQPKQPERKGVIRQDLGDRFLVYLPDSESTVTVPKLYVYPDLKQLGESPRKVIPSSKKIPASKNNPRKNRRRKGEGSGSIHYRMVTKNGKQYQSAYYHWRENGKKRTKYISNKLLNKVLEAESRKLPVADILVLLGGDKKSPRKSSDTFKDRDRDFQDRHENSDSEKVMDFSVISPRKITPPSKRRKLGYGAGYIECKPIIKSGKQYKQYWFHWEEWREGDLEEIRFAGRVMKKSRYIPKKLVSKVGRMNDEKAPVEKILKVLETKSKRRK